MIKKLIRRAALALLLAPLAAPLSGCKEKEQAAPPKPPDVEVVAVEQKDVPIYRDWVGTLEGDVNATISAQVSGYLLSRNYTEGSMVTNGQVLFQIDPAPFQAALDKAKAQVDQSVAQRDKYALDVQAVHARWRPPKPSASRNSTTPFRMRRPPRRKSRPTRLRSSRPSSISISRRSAPRWMGWLAWPRPRWAI